MDLVARRRGIPGYHWMVMGDAGFRVLILTLYSGEREFGACRQSVSSQRGVSCEHRVFENLTKAEAHARLYGTIVAESANFDLFLKLDADMAFAESGSLARIVATFQREPDLDHLVLGVADWFTDTDIIGLHTFSPRARWLPNPSGLFTDPDPVFPGRKLVVRRPRPVLVRHAFDPSPFQAFSFGVHRAMKACQPDEAHDAKRPFGARTNWWILVSVWRHFRRDHDPRLGLAILGADLVLRGKLPTSAVNRQDPVLHNSYEWAAQLGADELVARLRLGWSAWPMRQIRWVWAMGPKLASLVLIRTIRDVVTSPVRRIRQLRQERVARP